MKKFIRIVLLALALIMTTAQAGVVYATLTEEEQEASRKRHEEDKKKLQIIRNRFAEMQWTKIEVETETETEKVTEAVTETETETEKVIETETETEKVTEAETETETETEKVTETETEKVTEAMTETETETEKVTETETETEGDQSKLVVIDPGHQAPGYDMEETEPIGPGAESTRACRTSGTEGVVSGLAEYELNLQIALLVKEELEAKGYRVLLTREDAECALSSKERAEFANEAKADILLQLHANSDDADDYGALVQTASYESPYLGDIHSSCINLALNVLDSYCEATGITRKGLYETDNLTEINWSKMPSVILQMGYMTNELNDAYMAKPENQKVMAQGIADGIDAYFRS